MQVVLNASFWTILVLQLAFLDRHAGTTLLPPDVSAALALSTWREFVIVSVAQSLALFALVAASRLRFRNQRHRQVMNDDAAEIGIDAYDPSIRRKAVEEKMSAPTARLSLLWRTFSRLVLPMVAISLVGFWLAIAVAARIQHTL